MQHLSQGTNMRPVQHLEPEDLLVPLVKRVLLFSDGSTTHLLQNIIGHAVTVKVHDQAEIQRQDIPPAVAQFLPAEGSFLYRVSSLYSGQTTLSTNVVYASTHTLPEALYVQLSAGNAPLGSLISHFETRRDLLNATERCSCEIQPLFRHFTLSYAHYPVKEYNIVYQKKCWFYVCELFHLEHILQATCLTEGFQKE
jgi:chorismate-pyruvate lyase